MLTFNNTEYCELDSLRVQCEHRDSHYILEYAHIGHYDCSVDPCDAAQPVRYRDNRSKKRGCSLSVAFLLADGRIIC